MDILDGSDYFLTDNISDAWCGSYFANSERLDALPGHLRELFRLCMDSSHYYRQYWYWGGEAKLRVDGTKLKPTSIPDDEWAAAEAEAVKFRDEVAAESPRTAKVASIPRASNAAMAKAGRPCRYNLERHPTRPRPRVSARAVVQSPDQPLPGAGVFHALKRRRGIPRWNPPDRA